MLASYVYTSEKQTVAFMPVKYGNINMGQIISQKCSQYHSGLSTMKQSWTG